MWFDHEALDAARFYTELLGGRVLTEAHADLPPMAVHFELRGRRYMGLNGGAHYKLSPAVSLVVPCETQDEIDRVWDALLDGGAPQQCGWLVDRYGLSWQIIPSRLTELMTGEPDQIARVLHALREMVKLDLPTLERAHRGD